MAQNLEDTKVVFVLGGPGSGKGTQCSDLARDYPHLHHLSVGVILRAESNNPNSQFADDIRKNILEGRVGDPKMTCALLKAAMLEKIKGGKGKNVFLIDGFPRSLDRGLLFESTISPPSLVLLLDCPERILERRLLLRASIEGRSDDTAEVIRKRFETFSDSTSEVIEHYEKQGIVARVDAFEEVAVVYSAVKLALGTLLQ